MTHRPRLPPSRSNMLRKTSHLFLLFLILLLQPLLEARCLPPLRSEDVQSILGEVLASHATYHEVDAAVMQRSLVNYLEILDPLKTYFIVGDIQHWLEPTEDEVQQLLRQFRVNDFSLFERVQQAMASAIERRRSLEEKISLETLPKGVQPKEFRDLKWAENEQQLYERLLRIRALQADAAEKLNAEDKERTLLRIAKRRQKAEDEIAAATHAERQQWIHTHLLKAITGSLDAHTAYFTPAEASQFMIQVQQRLFGIGVQIRDDLNGFTLVKILEGGPAAEQKQLKANDRVVAVNGDPVVGFDIEDVVELIRGPEGTKVNLTVLRASEETPDVEHRIDLSVQRGEVILKETRYEVEYEPFGDGVIGHIRLFTFYQDANHSSTSDLREVINDLKNTQKLKGIILDMRHNVGGLLPQAVSVTGLFINKGIVASIKDSDGSLQHLRDIEGNPVWDGPLLVLMSRSSASAAEIVAQTLQDYGRAIVVGDPQSFGKGTFQTFTLDTSRHANVNPRGEYKVTRGRYYTVSGKSPQLVGVQSDIVVPGALFYAEVGEQYSKYPLVNDQIEPHFEDTLEDIPFSKRQKMSWLYKYNLQQKLSLYTQYLQQLKDNSQMRVKNHKAYQSFLQEIQKSESPEDLEIWAACDFQYRESLEIMKDLLSLMH